jgi:hypothetical protein
MEKWDTYEVVPHPDGWAVKHKDEMAGPYQTKLAAFEAAASLVEQVIVDGRAVELRVPAVEKPQD